MPKTVRLMKPAPSAQALFEDWLSVREHDSFAPLTREAAEPYRFIWKKWTDWLSNESPTANSLRRPASYQDATPLDAERFLRDGPSPSSRRNGKSPASPISPVTRLRYGRVLRELHNHAVFLGLCTTQPFTDSIIGPQPTLRQRGGQVLPPGVFEQLSRGVSRNPTSVEVRDDAMMLMLLQTGMTSGEVRDLTLQNVTRLPSRQTSFAIHIAGDRYKPSREVRLSGRAGSTFQRWLMHLADMGKKTEFVFVSERGPQLQRAALFRLVASRVQKACEELGIPVPNHVGPGAIRNTVIVNRLRAGEPIHKVALAMGIKEERSILRGLGHHLSS